METGLSLLPVQSVAPMGELGHNGSGLADHAVGKAAGDFHTALQAVNTEVEADTCCGVLPSRGETEQASVGFGGTGAEPTVAVSIALAGISPADSGEPPTPEDEVPIAESVARNEHHITKPILSAPAIAGQAPLAQIPTEGPRRQASDDISGDSLARSLAGLQPTPDGGATLSVPISHVVTRRLASGDSDRQTVGTVSARLGAPIQNQQTGDVPLTGVRRVRWLSLEWSSEQPIQPGVEPPPRSSVLPGAAPVQVGADLPTDFAQRTEPVMTQANAHEGQIPPTIEFPRNDELVAATTETDRSTHQGTEQTTGQSTDNGHNAMELINKPAGQAAVQLGEPGQSVSVDNGMPHLPSAPVAQTEITQSDAPFQATPTQPEMSVRNVEHFTDSGNAKTVQAVQVDLDPNDLGQVRVRVVLADSTVHTHVTTEHADLGQWLLNRRDQLESALQASGLDMGQFRVSVDRQASGQAAYDWIARTFGEPPRQQQGQREQVQQDHILRHDTEPRVLSVFA